MLEWFSWTNLFYLSGLILAGVATLMASKYKALMSEVGDVAKALEEAYADKKLTATRRTEVGNKFKMENILRSK